MRTIATRASSGEASAAGLETESITSRESKDCVRSDKAGQYNATQFLFKILLVRIQHVLDYYKLRKTKPVWILLGPT